jgi:hypothetical protein
MYAVRSGRLNARCEAIYGSPARRLLLSLNLRVLKKMFL